MSDFAVGVERVMDRLEKLVRDLPPESRLPSVRQLMRTHDVGQSAVTLALDRLEARGVIERRPRSGIFSAKVQRKRLLVLVEVSLLIGPSEYGELLLDHVLRSGKKTLADRELVYLRPDLDPGREPTIERFLGADVAFGLDSGRYGAIIGLGIPDRFARVLDRGPTPLFGYSMECRTTVRSATLDGCRRSVHELVRLGCETLSLAQAPYLSARETFLSALAETGAREVPLPVGEVRARHVNERLPRRYNLYQRGHDLAVALMKPGTLLPDGLISMDDTFTHGLLTGLSMHGFDLSRLKIATYSNLDSPRLADWEAGLVRMECDLGAIARELFAAAEAALESRFPTPGWSLTEGHATGSPGYLRVLPLRLVSPFLR